MLPPKYYTLIVLIQKIRVQCSPSLNRMFPCRSLLPTSVVQTGQNYFVYFFYNSFWAVWHLQSSPRSTPAVPVATLLGFNVHAIVITAPTSAIRAEVWERDCRCACALQSPRDFNWTQLLYTSFSKWHSLVYRLRLLSRRSQEDFRRWLNDEGFCDNIIQGRSRIGFVIVTLLGNKHIHTFVCRWMVNDFCFLLMVISRRWVKQ